MRQVKTLPPIVRIVLASALPMLGCHSAVPASALPAPAAAAASSTPSSDATQPPRNNMMSWTVDQRLTGFRSIASQYPTHAVAHGPTVLPLPKQGPELTVEFEHEGTRYDLDRYMQAFGVTGVLVIHHGAIRLERYAHARREDEPWISFSVTKSITSTLLGAAIRDGHIKSLDEPVTRYIPELAGSVYDAVNLRQLLTMTSGVQWNEDYSDPKSDVSVRNFAAADQPGDPVINYMRRLTRAHPPGTRFNYNTGETDLVGYVVRRAIGRPLSDYLAERIWKPFGMEHEANWLLDRSGNDVGGCCLSMSLRDYGRFGMFMLRKGTLPDGRHVLPDDWIADATREHTEAYPGMGYGYLWWVPRPGLSYDADGIFGQLIHVVPSQELVIVHNSAWPRPVGRDLSSARIAFIMAAQRAALAK